MKVSKARLNLGLALIIASYGWMILQQWVSVYILLEFMAATTRVRYLLRPDAPFSWTRMFFLQFLYALPVLTGLYFVKSAVSSRWRLDNAWRAVQRAVQYLFNLSSSGNSSP